jgi:hypothetical protein
MQTCIQATLSTATAATAGLAGLAELLATDESEGVEL